MAVARRWRATSPSCLSNIARTGASAVGFLASRTLRVTTSTSVSVSSTLIRKRSRSFWSAEVCDDSDDCPDATSATRLANSVWIASATSGEHRRAFPGLADVLLRLVEDEHGEGKRIVRRERLLREVHELLSGEIVSERGKLSGKLLAHVPRVGGEVGVDLEEGVGDPAAHQEVVEFPRPVRSTLVLRDRRPHRVERRLVAQPEAEAGLGNSCRQAAGAKEDPEHRAADALVAAEQGPRGGEGWLVDPAGAGVQFRERRPNLGREPARDQGAGRDPVVERRVRPEVSEHLEEVRLAAPEEAADPGGFLPLAADVGEESFKNALQPVSEAAVADEALQLGAVLAVEHGLGGVSDAGLSLVRQDARPGVAFEKFVDLRQVQLPLCSVIACAR